MGFSLETLDPCLWSHVMGYFGSLLRTPLTRLYSKRPSPEGVDTNGDSHLGGTMLRIQVQVWSCTLVKDGLNKDNTREQTWIPNTLRFWVMMRGHIHFLWFVT